MEGELEIEENGFSNTYLNSLFDILYLIFLKRILKCDISDFDTLNKFLKGSMKALGTNSRRIDIFFCVNYMIMTYI